MSKQTPQTVEEKAREIVDYFLMNKFCVRRINSTKEAIDWRWVRLENELYDISFLGFDELY